MNDVGLYARRLTNDERVKSERSARLNTCSHHRHKTNDLIELLCCGDGNAS